MEIRTAPRLGQPALDAGLGALLSSALSVAALLWRGWAEHRSPFAPLNAVAHVVWPREALRRDAASARFTGTGTAVHVVSSLFWAVLYGWLRQCREEPTAANALADAAALTAFAAAVDLKVVPKRLSPGFEERLSAPSLGWVYTGFGLGLAIGGLLALRR